MKPIARWSGAEPFAMLPTGLDHHRVHAGQADFACEGEVLYSPVKSLWFSGMAASAAVGGFFCFRWDAFALFVASTAFVLLFGHSLGSHRQLIHHSFQCPRWLRCALIYCGVLVGLAGPLSILRQHELRDYAQRLPVCHDYLRHGRGFWTDAWWQLHCDLHLAHPPGIRIEPFVANDRFLYWLERTWMLQQLPIAVLFHLWGGWAFVFWGVRARHRRCAGPLADRLVRPQPRRDELRSARRRRAGTQHSMDLAADHG
ncbi:fatty acid desaturase family protein [Variovorax atrisoli]|uniref:hypothetical protein n=1 Tax=Variovorax atrisoli TaxID=3394203 RepID=UPI0021A8A1A1|nr:hypothetical protein [Variovorax sp. BK613]